MAAILNEEPPDVGAVSKPIPPGLARIVRHCLEKEPGSRFQSARDVRFDLESLSEATTGATVPLRAVTGRRQLAIVALGLAALGVCAATFFAVGKRVGRNPVPSFHRLTFRRGAVTTARFAPDGQTVVYSASWDGAPAEMFSVRLDSPESHSLGYVNADLLAVAPSSELAIARGRPLTIWADVGTLALAPFSGGAPRDLEERIGWADFSRDGREMAVVRQTDQGYQLEYPMGTVLARTSGWISHPRISPDGQLVAFIDRPSAMSLVGSVAVVDRAGRKKTLTAAFTEASGLAWSPRGNEIWFNAGRAPGRWALRAVTLGGTERLVFSETGHLDIQDVAANGRVLVSVTESRGRIFFRGEGDTAERELSWLDWSLLQDLSPDGRWIAFFESGEGTGVNNTSYLRETSGAPPIKLGSGHYPRLAQDGRLVVVVRRDLSNPDRPQSIVLYPTGPGKETTIDIPGIYVLRAGLLPDGRTIWFLGHEPTGGNRLWLTDLAAARPRPVTPDRVPPVRPFITPDGKHAIAGSGSAIWLYPLGGGEPRLLNGVQGGEEIAAFAADGQSIFVYRPSDMPVKVDRVDLRTGRRGLVREIAPADRAGLLGNFLVLLTPDGRSCAYTSSQVLSGLYLIEGLK
jgi:Tol biopolymer transport system component